MADGLPLPFQFLQNIQFQFGTRRALHNFKQTAQCHMVRPFVITARVVVETVKQMVNPNQAANTFRQRVVKTQHENFLNAFSAGCP